ncbi:MAG: NAD(P)-binding domain-containing protein [Bacteroidales bacterium]|nr:NAD(P)-binding domain-containing protein [Bacteroidales bacterium]
METGTLGFIGGGRITRIILQAFKNKNVEFESVRVFEPDAEASARLVQQFPDVEIAESNKAPAEQDIVFLAVHPPVIMDTLREISSVPEGNSIVISLAPKITMEKISRQISSRKIIRMIPNATSFINRGYNPVCFSDSFSREDKKSLMKLFRIMGKTKEIDEKELEAYAIVSAMLPTYFWFQWKKMEDIAMKTGFTEDESRKIIRDTLTRTIKLYYQSGLSPDEVIDLIPVKPLGDKEEEIEEIFESKLLGLYEKIKP